MDNWPLFEERSAPRQIADTPAFQDQLVAILIILFAVGTLLWAIHQRTGRNKSIGSHFLLILFLSLQTIALIGFLYGMSVYSDAGSAPFWSVATVGMLYGIGYLLLQISLYSVFWYAFGTRGSISKWFQDFFKVWGATGLALYLPLLVMLTDGSTLLLGILSGVIYFLYRMLIIYTTFNIFPNLLKYPLHIILYLCTCEIAPLLFLLV